MGNAGLSRQIVLGAQHFGQRPGRAKLGLGDGRLVRLHPCFKRDT
jgi:hypothetical protein